MKEEIYSWIKNLAVFYILLTLLLTVDVLCMLTFIILMVSFGGGP